MSFEHALVTKGLMVGAAISSILVGLFDIKHYFHIQLVPHQPPPPVLATASSPLGVLQLHRSFSRGDSVFQCRRTNRETVRECQVCVICDNHYLTRDHPRIHSFNPVSPIWTESHSHGPINFNFQHIVPVFSDRTRGVQIPHIWHTPE